VNPADEITPPLEAPVALGDARPVNPTSVRATERVIFDKLSETPTDAVQSSSRAASAPPTVAEIPGLEAELQEVRRLRGEEGLDDVLKGVQQTLAHVTGELDKRRELIPEWEDSTTCALELPEVVKFAKQHGVTDEQIEHFKWHGTAAELRRWRDHWRAHEAAARRRATDRAERDETETSRPTQPRRRAAPRVSKDELHPMGIHAAKKLLERFVD